MVVPEFSGTIHKLHQSQEADVLKAKELSEEYNFTGFVYNNEVARRNKTY